MWIRFLIGIALAVSAAAGCSRERTQKPPQEAPEQAEGHVSPVTTAQEFDSRVLKADKPVLVDFSADWCPPCRTLAPIIGRLAGEYAGRVEFVKVDVDSSRQVARTYDIRGLPTVMIFNGGKAVNRLIGLRGADEYRSVLDALLP